MPKHFWGILGTKKGQKFANSQVNLVEFRVEKVLSICNALPRLGILQLGYITLCVVHTG